MIETAPNPFRIAADLADPEGSDWPWAKEARPEQLPPDGDWFIFLYMAGRGAGKSRSGAEWLAQQARAYPDRHWAVAARSTQDCRETCLEGQSGLLRALVLDNESPEYNRTTGEIRLRNRGVIHAYGAEQPDRFRGPNLSGAWCDEFSSWRYASQVWNEGLMPALRIPPGAKDGPGPKVLITTTPRPTKILRELTKRDDGSVIVVRGSTFDNAANLSAEALRELKRRYEGTRIGRQELYGELIEDVEGALWHREMFDDPRVEWAEGQP